MRHRRLRPGLHVVRRDDHHVQVGVDPPWRVVAPDEPEVRRLLDELTAGRSVAPASPAAHRTLLALDRAGMLVDASAAAEERRRTVRVQAGPEARDEVVRVVRSAGCEPAADGAVALVVVAGEVPRPDVDSHLREGRAHLPLAAGPRGWTIGPFVVPGASACLRCVDAHRGEHDPRRALVVDQLAGLPSAPDDPVLAALALAWAVRDVRTHLDGGVPSTWCATVELGPELRPLRRAWARHPYCGCSWA
ncbi:MAG: hypothetical protein H6529_05030 [Nocardioides sp.]|nr:hypothetical protein [Nocardioides sp.]